MNKKIYIPFILITIIFINSCGFTPKYANYEGINFQIEIDKFTGDRELNNFLKSKLKRYNNKKNKKLNILTLDLNSKFERNSIAKNTKGEVTKYELKAIVNITLKFDDETRVIVLTEKFKIDKIEDSVEQNNYIIIVKKDFADQIVEKLIFDIRTKENK